ncbi:GH36-type glycosyl hydrolase domain-containing protein [Streptomyces monticola]|uniref:GH36-type glycosyl hydrolase domain-containing protein n=1 Tax=Streptomyces monticola TaxID=2666263 RepID=A0ABW2JD13_9ACTN
MSSYGDWTEEHGLPAFALRSGAARRRAWNRFIDPPTRRRWVHLGNRRLTLVADTEGRSGLWDEHLGLDWLTEPEPRGTGVSTLEPVPPDAEPFAPDGEPFALDGEPFAPDTEVLSSGDPEAELLFGPTYARVRVARPGVRLERTVLCPEGEAAYVVVRVEVVNCGERAARWRLSEEWDVRQRSLDYLEIGPRADVPTYEGGVVLALDVVGGAGGGARAQARAEGQQGVLRVGVPVELAPGERYSAWFRFGPADAVAEGRLLAPQDEFEQSLAALRDRLPRAAARQAPQAATEIPWHAALLTGAAAVDGLLGGHTLDQGSAYSYRHGFNGAARDPLQHALPLVYSEPDLALSVLRNTCAWAGPDGELPYALDARKQPRTDFFRPSDQNLWALWLAAEYAAATGDLAAFDAPVGFHPAHGVPEVPLGEHLRRQFRYFRDVVGTGEHGHVRIRNADWNDLVLDEAGVDRQTMIERGESVLNSAMAAWVLPVFAGLADRLGDDVTARQARSYGEQLRERVAGEWNGRWFCRARGPGAVTVGADDLWLEVQPWAILCGAAEDDRARELLATVDELTRRGSPLGARLRPPGPDSDLGAVWFAVNATLVWAAARLDPALAWDEWRRMTLSAHTAAYPGLWEGTLSGPDAYLPPESGRPGQTWVLPEIGVAMQSWPVANQHSHAQPLFAYLRLLGVGPTPEGRLTVAGGAHFESRTFTVHPDGSGRLHTTGPTEIVTPSGTVRGGSGEIAWGGGLGGSG